MKSFFGNIDRNKENKIASEYPAWTMPRQIANAREEIEKKQRALDGGFVERGMEGEYQVQIEREQKRLDDIMNSKPKFTDVEIDLCNKVYKELTKSIGASMVTYNEMHKGFVDAHKENSINTNSEEGLEVTSDAARIAQINGIRVTDSRRMSRNSASRLAKILGHVLGKNTNMERLRKMGSSKN